MRPRLSSSFVRASSDEPLNEAFLNQAEDDMSTVSESSATTVAMTRSWIPSRSWLVIGKQFMVINAFERQKLATVRKEMNEARIIWWKIFITSVLIVIQTRSINYSHSKLSALFSLWKRFCVSVDEVVKIMWNFNVMNDWIHSSRVTRVEQKKSIKFAVFRSHNNGKKRKRKKSHWWHAKIVFQWKVH